MSDAIVPEKIDVAVNIFAKPFMTSLAILSLLRLSGQRVGKLWLQFEPIGIKGDNLLPYCIYEYLQETGLADCVVFQPERWLGRDATDSSRFGDAAYRQSLRYQYAFENSKSRLLFIMHNDIFVIKDILEVLSREIGDAFAIGEIGQCWNCPASKADLAACAGLSPCKREAYAAFRPDSDQLRTLYDASRKNGIFARPYDQNGFSGGFGEQCWPLPECRVNEWACLINLEKTRPLTVPFGDAYPFGGYKPLGGCNLDIGVEWFRAMHRHGLHAKHINVRDYIKHWVGTGKNTPVRYARAEANAQDLLKKHFPDYMAWLKQKYPGIVS